MTRFLFEPIGRREVRIWLAWSIKVGLSVSLQTPLWCDFFQSDTERDMVKIGLTATCESHSFWTGNCHSRCRLQRLGKVQMHCKEWFIRSWRDPGDHPENRMWVILKDIFLIYLNLFPIFQNNFCAFNNVVVRKRKCLLNHTWHTAHVQIKVRVIQ